jgi:hypothetical protein
LVGYSKSQSRSLSLEEEEEEEEEENQSTVWTRTGTLMVRVGIRDVGFPQSHEGTLSRSARRGRVISSSGRFRRLIPSAYNVRMPQGVYMRDDASSEMKDYAKMLSLLKLSSLESYTASKLIEGVRISIDQTRNKATVQYLTVVPFYNVTEDFCLDGMTRTKNKRRDLQPGWTTCTGSLTNDIPAERKGEGQNMVLRTESSWSDPNAGGLIEEMHVSRTGELIVRSTVEVREGTASCRLVYHKVDDYRPKYSWNPLQALQIMRG